MQNSPPAVESISLGSAERLLHLRFIAGKVHAYCGLNVIGDECYPVERIEAIENVRSPRSRFIGEVVVVASAVFQQHRDGDRRTSGFESQIEQCRRGPSQARQDSQL